MFANPNDPVIAEESEERFIFWIELYDNVEASTQNVLAALKIKADTLARVEALKESGAGNAAEAERLAIVVAGIVDKFESTYVPTGRTLAEIINLPAKIFTKMIHLSGTLENSEGPPTARMREVFAKLKKLSADTDAQYEMEIKPALQAFEAVAQ